MKRTVYGWVVLGALAGVMGGCSLTDIGDPDDMASRQDQMRENRTIPNATEMPPGLGEDLPAVATPPPATSARPMTLNP